MYLDLSCPVELQHAELLRDDNRKLRAYLSLMNLSDRGVARIEGEVFYLSGASGQRAAAPFAFDVSAAPRARFRVQVSTEQPFPVDAVELVFQRVEFEGGAAFEGDPGRMQRIEPPIAPRGRDLNRLVAVAGQDAQNFPVKTARYWICVCGRPNAASDAACARCQRRQADVLEKLSIASVLRGEALPDSPGIEHGVPEFLTEPTPAQQRLSLQAELQQMRAQFQSQRNLLIRRSVFLLVMVVVVLLLMYAFEWLGEKSEQARELRPPVRVEETVQPEAE